jgi:hypothetical protein
MNKIRKELTKGWLLWFKSSIEHIIDSMIEDMDTNYEEDSPERIANYVNERVEEELGKLERGIKRTYEKEIE